MNDALEATRLTIETGEDNVTVYANVAQGVGSFKYFPEILTHLLSEYGCRELSISASAHQEISKLCSENASGRIELGQIVDAKVQAIVSADKLSAALRITAAKGGAHITINQIMEALSGQEIDLSLVNKKRVVGLIKKSRIIPPGECIEVVIAKGCPPIHGKDTRFECLVDNIIDRKPHERKDGTLDYYDLGEIVCVDEGVELMRKYPPESAKNGKSVTGQELPARIGKKLGFKKCKGAVLSQTDHDVLISIIKGQPVIADRGVSVDKIYSTKNVDLNTGHIEYDGSLVVKGDVVSGIKIKVTGDIQIFGMVENATIEADGNIDIKLGAIGHAQDKGNENLMLIKCLGNLRAGYLENVQASVSGDILVKSRVSNCKLTAQHQIIVGNQRQEKSGIVGGYVTAGALIRAETLGSSGCAVTHLAIACDEKMLTELKEIKQKIAEQDEELVRKLGVMVALSKRHTADSKKELDDLKIETEALKTEIGELIKQKDSHEASIDQSSHGKVIAQKEAFPGVEIKILDQKLTIKSRYGKGAFVLLDGSISHNSYC